MIAQAKLINANHSENSTKALENYKKWKKWFSLEAYINKVTEDWWK
jgi:hypothetical protein